MHTFKELAMRRACVRSMVVMLVAAAPAGCVFNDIRDELEQTNSRLTRVEDKLGAIDKTNTELQTLREHRLSSLDTLDSMNQTLASIDTSLKSLDKHLAALRETISSIDNAIPFLSIGGGADDEEAEAAAESVIQSGEETGGESDAIEPEPAEEAPIDPEDEEPPAR